PAGPSGSPAPGPGRNSLPRRRIPASRGTSAAHPALAPARTAAARRAPGRTVAARTVAARRAAVGRGAARKGPARTVPGHRAVAARGAADRSAARRGAADRPAAAARRTGPVVRAPAGDRAAALPVPPRTRGRSSVASGGKVGCAAAVQTPPRPGPLRALRHDDRNLAAAPTLTTGRTGSAPTAAP